MQATLLNIVIFLPLLAALVVCMLPAAREKAAAQVALWAGAITGALAIGLWLASDATGLTGETIWNWIAVSFRDEHDKQRGVEIAYHVGLDTISGPLFALTGLLVPLSIACSFTAIRERVREYYVWMLLLTTGMFGVFAARDVLLFYVFFEFTLVPLYFLIGIWGGPERRFAANKFFLYTFVGSVITFAGIIYLAIRTAMINGHTMITFDLLTLVGQPAVPPAAPMQHLPEIEQSMLFLAFFCGFAIKVPFFPLHTWLPLAHTEAPTAGSVLLAGVLLKLGTYGFLRFSLPMVPEGAVAWAEWMGFLAVAGIIYGALCSWVQKDVKKLVAYSSVSHLGFCMLGMFSFLPVGISGSVLYMINHGLSTGALFLVIGMMYERYHTRDMEKIGGLARQMPILAFFLVFFTLSSIGLPGLNGFVSEFTTLLAAFASPALGPRFGSLGAAGILLGAIYMLYMVGRVLFGPLKEPHHTPDLSTGLQRDLNGREIGILVPIAAACVLLGVYPRIVTDRMDPLIQSQIVARVHDTNGYQALAAAQKRENVITRNSENRPGGRAPSVASAMPIFTFSPFHVFTPAIPESQGGN
jgi:NADH-quinone oxidoreductase subunit M